MKKSLKITVAALLAIMMIVSVLPFTAMASGSLYFSKTITLFRGKTVDLTDIAYYGDAIFAVKDSSVAVVSAEGLVYGVKCGTTELTVTGRYSGERLATYKIKVLNKVSVYGISIDTVDQIYSAMKNTIKLNATVQPSDATIKTVTWQIIYGYDIAKISDTGVLTTNGKGVIVVRCTSDDNSRIYVDLSFYVGGATATDKPTVPSYTCPCPYCCAGKYGCTTTCPYCHSTITVPSNWYNYFGCNSSGYYYDANGKLVMLPYVWYNGKYIPVTDYNPGANTSGSPCIFYPGKLTGVPYTTWIGTNYYNWSCIYNNGKWMTPAEIIKAHPGLSFIIGKNDDGEVYIIGTVGDLLSSHEICSKCGKCKTCGECTCTTTTTPSISIGSGVIVIPTTPSCGGIVIPSGGTNSSGIQIIYPNYYDVCKTDWYYNSVMFAINGNYMASTNSNSFGVYDVFTVGDMINTLAKVAKVRTDYTKWAVNNGIAAADSKNQVDTTEIVTRGMFANAVYKCALYMGKNVTKVANITSYYDYKDVPAAYTTAMAWAVANNLVPMYYPTLNSAGYISKVYLANAIYLLG